jgi:hypothetical protein
VQECCICFVAQKSLALHNFTKIFGPKYAILRPCVLRCGISDFSLQNLGEVPFAFVHVVDERIVKSFEINHIDNFISRYHICYAYKRTVFYKGKYLTHFPHSEY